MGFLRNQKKQYDVQSAVESTPKASLRQLFRYASAMDRLLLVIGCGCAMVTGIALPMMSVMMGDISQNFIDLANVTFTPNTTLTCDQRKSVMGSFTHSVEVNCIRYVLWGCGILCSATIQAFCFATVCKHLTSRLRKNFFNAIMRQNIAWFDSQKSGTLATTLFENVERVQDGTGDKLGLLVQFLSQFVGGFAVGFAYNWYLTLIILGFVPLMAVCGLFIAQVLASASKAEAKQYALAGSIAEESITSIRTVTAFNGQFYELNRYAGALQIGSRMAIRKGILMGIGLGMTFLIGFSSYCFTFWFGINFIYSGKMTPDTVMTVFFSVMLGAMALGQAGPQISALASAQGAAGVLYELIDRVPKIDAYSPEGQKPTTLKGDVVLENVFFKYPLRPDVQILKNISLRADAGQTVALVGASGCGKSTIIQLLLRYYDVNGGRVMIDGLPVDKYNLEYLRRIIGVVSQEPVLFNTTIEENIRYGRSDVTEEEIWSALKMANAHRFIQQMPQGLQTLVGDRGTQMSGGQKQRISIARALVRDPKILLLDEATSALDAESESIVQQALENASRGRTTIMIAHRLSTVRNANKIIVIKEGEVAEEGKHDDLIAKKGLYYELVNSQIFIDELDDMDKKTSRRESATSMKVRSNSATYRRAEAPKADEAINLKPEQELERMKKDLESEGARPSNLLAILSHARPEWKFFGIAIIASCFQGCVYPTFAFFFAQMLEAFSKPPDDMKKEGHFWSLMFLVLGGVELVTFFITCSLYGFCAERLTRRLRCQVFENILRMDGAFFDSPRHSAGKISLRLATDAPNVKAAVDNRFGSVFASLFSLICGIGIGFYFGWKMAIMCLAIFPLGVVGQTLQMRYMAGNVSQDPKGMEKSGKIATEAIEHVRTVQALTLQTNLYEAFCTSISQSQKHVTQRHIIAAVGFGFSSSIFFFLFAASFRFGLWLVVECHMLPFDMLKVLFAVSFTAGSMGYTSSYFTEYTKATMAAGLIFNMLRQTPQIDNLSQQGKKPRISGRVQLNRVHFRYPERSNVLVLNGLDIEVNPGETLALVGPSGCGKSTVVQLLERLYDPLDGSVTIDGEDIRQMNPRHLRSHIALVSQEPTLFDTSIRQNIVYGLEPGSFTERDILEAATKANIHKFVSELPQGYDTNVGEKGTQLSGGQKQRIAIARALVRNPRILLLDEATSALDTESEKVLLSYLRINLVQEALDVASEGRTSIVVAHRLSTIINANCIIVVNEGKVVESGTHTELMNTRGVYWKLTQKQTGSMS